MITETSSNGFLSAKVSEANYWAVAGTLARWFRFSPSEIDGLEVDDFFTWFDVANEQIKAQNDA